ncbi:hypothetical protein SH1V18_46430 [Vallitalea longa]|uniref:PqqD family protein n=1 Tax=Vallitalea longa TaxID=2936439 RepID=A0A9W6DI59_9FIRM|nr:PqqD family protein [Vallitalea longa]GKX32163.1 hypothetical protein SH1V18_46430 [Vallitalea longa]
MNLEKIPQSKTLNWQVKGGYVLINALSGKLMMNETSSLIWRKIDGSLSIQEIIEEIFQEYKKDNTIKYIEEIVCEAIQDFIDKGLLILKEEDDLDGWLQYE